MNILPLETANCPSWSGRGRMTVENLSRSISTKEWCRTAVSIPRAPDHQLNAHTVLIFKYPWFYNFRLCHHSSLFDRCQLKLYSYFLDIYLFTKKYIFKSYNGLQFLAQYDALMCWPFYCVKIISPVKLLGPWSQILTMRSTDKHPVSDLFKWLR